MALCDVLPNGNGNGNANGNANGGSASGSGNGAKEKSAASRNGSPAENSAPAPEGNGTKDWSVHIVGSDLLRSAIEVAERGLYPQSALAGLPPATIRACFTKIGNVGGGQNGLKDGNFRDGNLNDGNSNSAASGSAAASNNGSNGSAHLLVKPRLRSLITFNTMNLIKPVYIGRFDCIFCMDVLPHLSRAQRTALLERLHLYLEPGGYLFLSQTEKLSSSNLNFRSETFDGYTFHRKPLAASAAYGR